jgi:hypothetical protein
MPFFLSALALSYAQRQNFNYRTFFPTTQFEPMRYSVCCALYDGKSLLHELTQMPQSLSSVYRPYMGRPFDPAYFKRNDWELAAAYYDLQRYENELRHAKVSFPTVSASQLIVSAEHDRDSETEAVAGTTGLAAAQ